MQKFLTSLLVSTSILVGYGLRLWFEKSEPSLTGAPADQPLARRVDLLEKQQQDLQLALQQPATPHQTTQEPKEIAKESDSGSELDIASFQYSDAERARTNADLEARRLSLLQHFEREPRDPTWSKAMADKLEKSIAETTLPDAGIPHSIECKTTKCVATFFFANYREALEGHAGADIASTECSRFMLLPEPTDESVRYPAELILECQR
jgi:hypothetical protein